MKIVAIILIVAGILALVYGQFSYTKSTSEAKVGPFEFAVKEKKTVNLPVWLGVGAILAGVAMLLFPKKR